MQTKRLLWIVALGLALTLALLMALSPSPEVVRAASKDWFVETGGTGDCTQANPCALQMAVDQAGDSDTILVAGGVYTGTGAAVITVTKSITLYGGWDGAPTGPVVRDPDTYATTLDGENGRRVVYISGYIVPTIDGLRIIGGNATGMGGPDDNDAGGGVLVYTSTATISNCAIYSNTAPVFGGGLYLHESDAILTSNTVYSNTSGISGGGLFLYYSDATLSDNLIYSNAANAGGGGLFLYNSSATLSGNVVSGNDATHSGGGLGMFAGEAVLTNNVVVDNQAGVNGAGIFMEAARPRLWHSTIARNTGGDGSGVYVTEYDPGGPPPEYSIVAMTNTILVSHTVGIYATAGNVAILNGVLWYSNTANTGGAGTINVTNEIIGTPAFAPDGYHITSGSEAIDAGVDAGVTTDVDGDPRPIGPAPDIGADEARQRVYLPLVLRSYP